MAVRFNPAPGWPAAPEGWTPPPGWKPDPSWPPAPEGWQPWVEDGTAGANQAGNEPPPGPAPADNPQRPWYKKKRFLIPLGMILIFFFVVGIFSDPAATPTAEKPPAAVEEAGTDDDTAPDEEADIAFVEVPDLTGVLATDAVAQLEALGLTPEVRAAPADAIVTGTVPATGQTTMEGSTVTLLVESAEETAAAEAEAAAAAEAARLAEEEAVAAAEAVRVAEEERLAAEAAARGTVSQQNALESAQDYLAFTAFSRTGLIEQLEYEQFSTEDATWAVDRVSVDWNEQAAKSAKEYLEFTSFSRSGLIDQLLYEGFTPEQAEFGVSQTGL